MRKTFTASIYVRNEGKILLVFHKRFNMWVPVGGELEANESPLEAAWRELREETKLGEEEVTFPAQPSYLEGAPLGLLAYEEHDANAKGWHMNFAFVADSKTRDITMCDEHIDFDWFDASDGRLLIAAPVNVHRLVVKALRPERSPGT